MRTGVLLAGLALAGGLASASYVNFESSHVHPIALTPSGTRLLAVNTPDALLEVFDVEPDGSLTPVAAIPVGLEPVTVVARNDGEAWVVNHLSDTISVVDLAFGAVVRTLATGDEPTDVAFAQGKAFVAVSQEDVVRVFNLANLNAAPATVALFGRDVRALVASPDGQKVYAVVLRSGNQTTVLDVGAVFPSAGLDFDPNRLAALGLRGMDCDGAPPPYPPLPAGIERNPALSDPPDGVPQVGLIVGWDGATGRWVDDAGQDWTHCLPYRLPDHDLFVIDAASLAVSTVAHLGTSLFDVSVNPANGKIYVPNTEARNRVRFEHALGVRGHVVDNRMSVVDPAAGNAIKIIDLNAHIDRQSDPATNLAERLASVSQPGMMAWKADGSAAYLTAIGSRKLFRLAGGCLAGSCIFGPNRAAPAAVEVGEGPTGIALREDLDRGYVLDRIAHQVTIVSLSALTVVGQVGLHDPSPAATRVGRRFLYDGIDSSGHGDAACASCHLSGDLDGLAWDLGDPSGDLAPYSTPNDNVRFIVPFNGQPVSCTPGQCASHAGFDPQKGPMTTQSLRGMLEPLHWRGDRATMNDFNAAFVGLMGRADIGPIQGKPAGLSVADMEKFRQFALAVRYPPNPYRRVDDTTPCGTRAQDPSCEVLVPGLLFPGNPTEGARIFDNDPTDAGQPCRACHTHPFGAGGGALGGVSPAEPTSPAAAALFNGDADGSPHSDLKIPHARNMYEKYGPVWAAPGGPPVPTKAGFGYIHDGSIPDLYRFLSAAVFNLSSANQARAVRDLAAFMFYFPTGTRPAVGRQVTLPAGTPPSGPAADETLLASLVALGDLANAARHCELVASASSGGRLRRWHLAGGVWVPDVTADAAVTLQVLRESADGPLTFTCATLGSGIRLGGDRDEDTHLDGEDCAAGDPESWGAPQPVTGFDVGILGGTTRLSWDDQSATTGPGLVFDVLGAALSELRASGIEVTACLAGGIEGLVWDDPRPAPPAGDGWFYLVRAVNGCGRGDLGPGREPLDDLVCP